MNEQYEGWLKGPHHGVAICNSCHAPHSDIVYKYINKTDNGFRRALKFTFQDYPENIKIHDHSHEIVEAACIDRHGDCVGQTKNSSKHKGERMSCLRCHDGIGHKR